MPSRKFITCGSCWKMVCDRSAEASFDVKKEKPQMCCYKIQTVDWVLRWQMRLDFDYVWLVWLVQGLQMENGALLCWWAENKSQNNLRRCENKTIEKPGFSFNLTNQKSIRLSEKKTCRQYSKTCKTGSINENRESVAIVVDVFKSSLK